MLQARFSQHDPRMYCADRDLAWCSPNLIKRAILGLRPDRLEQWVKDYLAQNSVADEELAKAAEALAAYVGANSGVIDPKNKSPKEALEAVGFFALRPAVQTIALAKFGQCVLAAIFPCIRDVVRKPEDPPYDLAAIEEAVEDVRRPPKRSLWNTIVSFCKR